MLIKEEIMRLSFVITFCIFITHSLFPQNYNIYFSDNKRSCVSITKSGIEYRYIGYRIVEHKPEITKKPISEYADIPGRYNYPIPILSGKITEFPTIPKWQYTGHWLSNYTDQNKSFRSYQNGVVYYKIKEDNHLYRIVILRPVGDGVELWMWLEGESNIQGSYLIQCCFRLSGDTNSEWRHGIALIPELSEYDLWSSGDSTSLTFVLNNNTWYPIKATKEVVYYYTGAGYDYYSKKSSMINVQSKIPCGLIIRESIDRHMVAGMYWEKTAAVSNHHPADCLHAFVDLGPLKAGHKNIVHGKLYWFDGNKQDLLEHWKQDFNR
jgi:hypothetical protein